MTEGDLLVCIGRLHKALVLALTKVCRTVRLSHPHFFSSCWLAGASSKKALKLMEVARHVIISPILNCFQWARNRHYNIALQRLDGQSQGFIFSSHQEEAPLTPDVFLYLCFCVSGHLAHLSSLLCGEGDCLIDRWNHWRHVGGH